MSSELLNLAFWEQVLAGGVRLGVPVSLAALGETVGERAGVLNLGLEGTMAIGAFAGFEAARTSGSPLVGLAVGAVAGLIVGLCFAAAVVWARADEVVCGFAFAIAIAGLATFLFRSIYESGVPPRVRPIGALDIPVLSDIPLIGRALFSQTPVVYLLPVAAAVTAWMLTQTRFGLELRACGEDPHAASLRGVDVRAVRTRSLAYAGVFGGLGGAFLSVGLTGAYQETIVGGRGFVAIALVIVGRFRPWLVVAACLGFGSMQAFQLRVQTGSSIGIPSQVLVAVPFLATLFVLTIGRRASASPAGLGRTEEAP